MTNDNSMIGQMDPGPEKLATFLLHHFNDLRVAPSSALDSCGLSRALWKLAAGLSIPLLKLCLMSGLISGLEALNVQSPTVQEEIKGITTKSPVQFWRLTESEGELIRLFRYIDSQRGRELIRDVAMGQVRLSNHKNSVLLEEDVEMIDSIINQEVKKESTDG